jgi:DNA-binding NarL/FixJ family response regulator
MATFERSIDVVEASYRLHVTDREWLHGIAQATRDARPVPGVGLGTAGFLFEAGPAGASFRSWEPVVLDCSSETVTALAKRHAASQPWEIRKLYRSEPIVCATLSELGLPASQEQMRLGVRELLGLQVTDRSGLGMALLFALPKQTHVRRSTRAHWLGVVEHMRAGLRLRHAVATQGLWHHVEAVIEPGRASGAVRAASGAACAPDAQARLCQAASMIDGARTRTSRRQATAPAAWPALVDGRWTLVEHVDSDGRRYYLALQNQPAAASLVALTPHERQVVEKAVLGLPNKLIADALGLSEQTIGASLTRAMSKLRVKTRTELMALATDLAAVEIPVEGPIATVMAENRPWLLRSGGTMDQALASFGFTQAEAEVVRGILQGHSNEVIAQTRGAQTRTIANQVQSVFRKATAVHERLGERGMINSRSELIVLINRLMLRPAWAA